MSSPHVPIDRRPLGLRCLSVIAALVACALVALPVDALAASTNATATAPAEPIGSAQALADALNADAPAGTPHAEVSADGTTVSLLAPLTVEGDHALDVAVPANSTVTLDLAANDLHLENGDAELLAQLVATGEGTFAITSSGGAIVSTTADGTISSLQASAGRLEVHVPVTVETTVHQIAALRADGGTLVLGDGAQITGSADAESGFTGVLAGELILDGGSIRCTGDEPSVAILVRGGTASLASGTVQSSLGADGYALDVEGEGVATISGAELTGAVLSQEGGSLTILDGDVQGFVGAQNAELTVTVNPETGYSASFNEPVEVRYLDGVGAVEFEFNGEVGTTYFRYFADAAAAKADAERYPSVNWATVSEDAYICWNGFLDNAEDATAFYDNFYESIGYDNDTAFAGPTMMDFVMTRPGLTFTFTYRDAAGNIVYTEDTFGTETSVIWAPFFNASLPGAPADGADAAVGVGTYTLEIASKEDPSIVYSTSTLGISKVTLDAAGGTYPADYATVKYLMQNAWSMKEVPVREGFVLDGWSSAPIADLVGWDATYGVWYYDTPRTGADLTFTARWVEEVVEVSRLWNPYDGAHLLSTDADEVKVLTGRGWRDEGPVFSVYGYAAEGSTPVTRLYNPNNGDHLYTTSADEIAGLTALGWRDEGVKFFGSPDDARPVYRLWNSLQVADGGVGSHLWTVDLNEYDTLPRLPPVGAWCQEGVAWNAVAVL